MRGFFHPVLPLAIAWLCTACATPPDLTPTQLAARQLAAVYVADTGLWKISATSKHGYRVEIAGVNGRSVCSPSYCPSRITLRAGHADITLLCSLLLKNLQLPKQTVNYSGEFVAGHVYQIRPASAVPACKIQLRDVTHEAGAG